MLTGPGEPVETCDLCDVALAGGGNGCDRLCRLENTGEVLNGDKFSCKHVFLDLKYELPRFCTMCTKKRRLLSTGETEEESEDRREFASRLQDKKLDVHNSPYVLE